MYAMPVCEFLQSLLLSLFSCKVKVFSADLPHKVFVVNTTIIVALVLTLLSPYATLAFPFKKNFLIFFFFLTKPITNREYVYSVVVACRKFHDHDFI